MSSNVGEFLVGLSVKLVKDQRSVLSRKVNLGDWLESVLGSVKLKMGEGKVREGVLWVHHGLLESRLFAIKEDFCLLVKKKKLN